jgi:hypothetical protein
MAGSVADRVGGTLDVEAAIEELEALLAERSWRWATEHYYKLLGRVCDGDLFETWARAVLTLRERGTLGADEAAHFLAVFGREAIIRDYEQDAELRSARNQMDAIARAHGRQPGNWWPRGPAPEEWATLEMAFNERAEQVLAGLVRGLGEVELADVIEGDETEYIRRFADGGMAFDARWPHPDVDEPPKTSARGDATLVAPDTARRAHRQDVKQKFGPFCPEDDRIVIVATLIEQALHFPDVDVDELLEKADRIARELLARWSPDTPIMESPHSTVDLGALSALAEAIQRKLPNLGARLEESVNRLHWSDLGEAYPANMAEAEALQMKYQAIRTNLEGNEDAYLDVATADLGGLSVTQAHEFTLGNWLTTGPLRLDTTLSLADLERCDILHDARATLAHLRDMGQLETLADGNLSPRALETLSPKLRLHDEMLGQDVPENMRNGEHFWLWAIRHLLEHAECSRQRRGDFRITRHGRAMLEDDRAGDLAAQLFITLFNKSSLTNIDRFHIMEQKKLSLFIGASFYLLGKQARDWTPAARLTKRAWPKSMRDAKFPNADLEKIRGEVEVLMFSARVLRPLVAFGLMEWCVGSGPALILEEYRVTPLFDRFLRFEPLTPTQPAAPLRAVR